MSKQFGWWVLGGITAIAFVSRMLEGSGSDGALPRVQRSKVSRLVKQAIHWRHMGQQDRNLLFQLVHLSFALSYARSVRAMASAAEVERAAGINIDEFVSMLDDEFHKVMEQVNQSCPALSYDGRFQSSAGLV